MRRRGSWAVLLLAALWLGCGASRPPAPDRQFRFERGGRLLEASNGLRVLLLPDPSTEIVQVDLRVAVGSADDPAGKEGLAHVVEHVLFHVHPAGPAYPSLDEILSKVALSKNAYTGFDATHYSSSAHARDIDVLIGTEVRRLSARCDQIEAADFEREREIVRNERRERDQRLQPILLAAAYPPGHPYRRPPIGTDESIAAITLADVCDFHARYYAPQRATLIITGPIDEPTLRQVLERHLPALPPRQAAPRAPAPPVRYDGPSLERASLDVLESTSFGLFPLPPRFGELGAVADLLIAAAATELSERAADVDEITSVATFPIGGPRAPVLVLAASFRDPEHRRIADDLIADATSAVAQDIGRVTLTTLRHAKQIELLQRADTLSARGPLYADYLQFRDDQSFVVGELERLDEVVVPALQITAEVLFGNGRRLHLSPSPGEARRSRAKLAYRPDTDAASHDHLDVDPALADAPLHLPPPSAPPPQPRRFSLENGLEVWLQPAPNKPLVDIRLVVRAGNAHEPPELAGLADLAAFGLGPDGREDAVSTYNAATQGSYVATTVTDDATTFRIVGMRHVVDHLLAAVAATVVRGEYDDDWEDSRDALARSLDDDEWRRHAERIATLRPAVYGDHPYGRVRSMSPDSVRAIDLDDIEDFRDTYLRPERAVLIIAGTFDPELIERHVRYQFEDWDRGDAVDDHSIEAPAARPSRPARFALEGDDSAQTGLYVLFPTAPGVGDGHAARLIVRELVNLRVSRVREELAASYGVYGAGSTALGPGLFSIGGLVDSQRVAEALAAMTEALASLRRGDDLAADFVRARRAVARRLMAETTDTASVATRLSRLALLGLPPDYHQRLVREVAATTLPAVRATIAKVLAPEAETLLVVGDRDELSALIEESP